MLKYLLTYHQVMPGFLDFLLSFGTADFNMKDDFFYTGFHHDDRLAAVPNSPWQLSAQDRSGQVLRHCYILRSAEKSEKEWSIRQTAVYHSFDIINGNSFWITVKANAVIKKRVMAATTSFGPLKTEAVATLSGAFIASLFTHLLMFEWCGENWRAFISDKAKELDGVLRKARAVPLDINSIASPMAAIPTPGNIIKHLSSGPLGGFNKRPKSTVTLSEKVRNFTSAKGRGTAPGQGLASRPKKNPTPTNAAAAAAAAAASGVVHQQKSGIDRSQLMNEFNFGELQKLHRIGYELRRALLVLMLNVGVLEGILQYYETALSHLEMKDISIASSAQYVGFVDRMRAVQHDLETQAARIETLMCLLEDGKVLVMRYPLRELSLKFNSKLTVLCTYSLTASCSSVAWRSISSSRSTGSTWPRACSR